MDSSKYYQKVADYYDRDACNYEERYWQNPVARRIRQSFREEVKNHPFKVALEIGCGTGLDATHFGSIFPDREVFGLDIAPVMVSHATKKIQAMGLSNVRIAIGTPENIPEPFPQARYDLIYVFFGALNNVPDLPAMAAQLRHRLKPGGVMVLTFVNRWYLADTLIHLLKLRFKGAFRRFKANWGGYSEQYQLESRCYSPGDIRRAFGQNFTTLRTQGYSILFPAWYRLGLAHRLGRKLCDALWEVDRWLSRTPAWCLGEYALYTFRARN